MLELFIIIISTTSKKRAHKNVSICQIILQSNRFFIELIQKKVNSAIKIFVFFRLHTHKIVQKKIRSTQRSSHPPLLYATSS